MIIFLMSADRTGKTTYANKLSATPLQFNAPAKGLSTWYEDYDRARKTDLIYGDAVCARGPLEANLYRFVSLIDINKYLVWLHSKHEVRHVLLNKHWDSTMEKRHTTELLELGYTEPWRIKAEVVKRMQEHYDYYKHINKTAYELNITLENKVL